jgi:hypothetical protein
MGTDERDGTISAYGWPGVPARVETCAGTPMCAAFAAFPQPGNPLGVALQTDVLDRQGQDFADPQSSLQQHAKQQLIPPVRRRNHH